VIFVATVFAAIGVAIIGGWWSDPTRVVALRSGAA